MIDLPLIWAGILSFVVIMYVILDGFDLGIGILFPWMQSGEQRDIMMSTVVPVWDGNETWLVLGGACLYGAFPLAYSTLLPTLYMPLTIMLAALIFRGVAFEFRFKAERSRFLWDIAFSGGSTLAAFCQGLVLGTFVTGYSALGEPYVWLTPFSAMTGIAVVAGYALLGSTWLIAKTTGELQDKMYQYAKGLLLIVAFFMAVVSIWTPLSHARIWERWFTVPNFFYLLPLPLLTGIAFLWNWIAIKKRRERLPFALSVSLFIFAYIGFCISDWPYIIPHQVTITEAAAPTSSLKFMLVGVCILLPVLLAYTYYSYHVFKGKVSAAEHHY